MTSQSPITGLKYPERAATPAGEEVVLEQSEDMKGNWVQTVRLANGEEIVRKVPQCADTPAVGGEAIKRVAAALNVVLLEYDYEFNDIFLNLLATRAIEAARPASPLRGRDELHPDTQDLVEKLSWALEDKLLRSQKKYGYTNGWLIDDWEGQCRQNLRQHLEKGDPLDVVAYAAFMWARGWPTASKF